MGHNMSHSPTAVAGQTPIDRDDTLLARSLQEAQEALDASFHYKGKRRSTGESDDSLSDEELAIQLQAEYLRDSLRDLEDFRVAKRLSGIVDDDELQTTMEHRRALLASSIKLGLPGPSNTSDILDKDLYVPHFRSCPPH